MQEVSHSPEFIRETSRAWLVSQVNRFAIHPNDAQRVYLEVIDTGSLESMGDFLEGVGHPELAEQWERDWVNVEYPGVEELYAEVTEEER